MQKTTVLVDGFQFLGRSGTGIASYVENSNRHAQVSGLFGWRSFRPAPQFKPQTVTRCTGHFAFRGGSACQCDEQGR